ncbi:DMT family transporter [Sphingobacterium sp. HJSM2_6]|uniref:DMT family transporter n=1 Tax=Sphingobacterium sp. HJSM2_6 TaxID=3366264 RepID=UPI003BBF710A
MKYLYLIIAIVCEIFATTYLKKSEGFSLWKPTLICVIGYLVAFYFLSLTLKSMPVGVAYALWSGIGIVFITLVGLFIFKQTPDLPAILGITLIVAGVLVINLFSKMSAH